MGTSIVHHQTLHEWRHAGSAVLLLQCTPYRRATLRPDRWNAGHLPRLRGLVETTQGCLVSSRIRTTCTISTTTRCLAHVATIRSPSERTKRIRHLHVGVKGVEPAATRRATTTPSEPSATPTAAVVPIKRCERRRTERSRTRRLGRARERTGQAGSQRTTAGDTSIITVATTVVIIAITVIPTRLRKERRRPKATAERC